MPANQGKGHFVLGGELMDFMCFASRASLISRCSFRKSRKTRQACVVSRIRYRD